MALSYYTSGVASQRRLLALGPCDKCKAPSAYSFPRDDGTGRYISYCVAHTPVRVNGRPLSVKKAATVALLRKLGLA